MAHILLLEDDSKLGKKVWESLIAEGYSTVWAKDLKTARLEVEKKIPDLYLLDWTLPDGTGFEWAKEIRKNDIDVPIVFLTARSDHESAVQALSHGANDFMRKPFGYEELFLRIKKALKEVIQEQNVLKFGDLSIEKNQMGAFVKNKKLSLTPTEYQILELLIVRANSVVSRQEIVEILHEETSDRTLDSHVSRIRKNLKEHALEKVKISSVYGVGYKLEKESA